MKVALHWFRRDLRVADNTALFSAVRENEVVWPIFILDPKTLQSPDMGGARLQFLLDSLKSLQRNVEFLGGQLVIRQGNPLQELQELVRETQATSIYWNRDYEPKSSVRDAEIEQILTSQSVTIKTFKDDLILEPNEVLKPDGTPYLVFTPYSRVWRKAVRVKRNGTPTFRIQKGDPPASIPVPTLSQLGYANSAEIPMGGEKEAQGRLKRFVREPIFHYQSQRNLPAIEGTSRLSADLCIGTLSPRQIYLAAEQAKSQHPATGAEIETFITELVWRDFYRSILWHFPHVAERCFKEECDHLEWENDERYFKAWCEGRTGFPIVDAAMRQLNQTGWMHNRLRMIVASFLTKDLLIDYKWGERYFMRHLVDGDLASNNGGWQWSASTGTDAQPYFRIFNPTSQAERFDPEGRFIERFVPESNTLSYPPPIIDHAVQREKALRLFKRIS